MSEHIQAIYENGVLRPLQPLDLPENKIVEIDVRDAADNEEKESTNAEKIKAFDEWMNSLDPNTPNLTDEQISRTKLAGWTVASHLDRAPQPAKPEEEVKR